MIERSLIVLRESNRHSALSTTLDTSANAFSGSINFVHKEREGGREGGKRRRITNEMGSEMDFGIRSKAFRVRYPCVFNAKLKCENTGDTGVPLTQKFDLYPCGRAADKRAKCRVEGAAFHHLSPFRPD